MLTEEERAENSRLCRIAVTNAKQVLKPGGKLRVAKCPGGNRTIIFARWDGDYVVSKSGIGGFHPICISKVNGAPVDFTNTPN